MMPDVIDLTQEDNKENSPGAKNTKKGSKVDLLSCLGINASKNSSTRVFFALFALSVERIEAIPDTVEEGGDLSDLEAEVVADLAARIERDEEGRKEEEEESLTDFVPPRSWEDWDGVPLPGWMVGDDGEACVSGNSNVSIVLRCGYWLLKHIFKKFRRLLFHRYELPLKVWGLRLCHASRPTNLRPSFKSAEKSTEMAKEEEAIGRTKVPSKSSARILPPPKRGKLPKMTTCLATTSSSTCQSGTRMTSTRRRRRPRWKRTSRSQQSPIDLLPGTHRRLLMSAISPRFY